MTSQPESDFLRELQNFHVRIPMLQALKELLIYAKTIRDLCIKKAGRKPKDPATIHVMGELSKLMFDQPLLTKYNNTRNPTFTIYINDHPITNTLIDLGATINVMTKDLFTTLGLQGLRHTPIVLELVDKSRVKPEGVLEDIVITIASWRYLTDFLILQPKSNLGRHPLILGRLWLATTDAFIGFRSRSMVISNGQAIKNHNLYPPKPNVDLYNPWCDDLEPELDISLLLLTLGKAWYFKDETKYDIINGFISNSLSVTSIKNSNEEEEVEDIDFEKMRTTLDTNSSPIEIEPGKFLKINPNLTAEQSQLLLQKYKNAFAWDYTDMKWIHPNL